MSSLEKLSDFGVRSVVTHAIMLVTATAAIVSAFVVGGDIGRISFVAFVNFTAGLWVCQSVHSLGNAYTGDDYEGVFKFIMERT